MGERTDGWDWKSVVVVVVVGWARRTESPFGVVWRSAGGCGVFFFPVTHACRLAEHMHLSCNAGDLASLLQCVAF